MTTLYRSFWGIVPALFLSVMAPADTLEGRCIAVADGDTASIRLPDGSTDRIRFWGIDAPESSQAFGQVSKKKLSEMILNKVIRVDFDSRDKYNRIVGRVYVGSLYVNLEMVRAGLAWHFVKYAPQAAEIREAEAAARSAKAGLWADPHALAPWEFRHPSAGMEGAVAEQTGKKDAVQFSYWVSNSGKTHNQHCKMFFHNSGTGSYTNTPSGVDAKCCGRV